MRILLTKLKALGEEALCCILGELLELGSCLLGSVLCFSIRVRDAVLFVVVMPISLVYGIVAHQYLLFCLRALRLSENHSMEIDLMKDGGAMCSMPLKWHNTAA